MGVLLRGEVGGLRAKKRVQVTGLDRLSRPYHKYPSSRRQFKQIKRRLHSGLYPTHTATDSSARHLPQLTGRVSLGSNSGLGPSGLLLSHSCFCRFRPVTIDSRNRRDELSHCLYEFLHLSDSRFNLLNVIALRAEFI